MPQEGIATGLIEEDVSPSPNDTESSMPECSTRASSPSTLDAAAESIFNAAHRIQLITAIRKARTVSEQLKEQKQELQNKAKNPTAHSWAVQQKMQRVQPVYDILCCEVVVIAFEFVLSSRDGWRSGPNNPNNIQIKQ